VLKLIKELMEMSYDAELLLNSSF